MYTAVYVGMLHQYSLVGSQCNTVLCRMLLSELTDMASKEPSSSKDEESAEDSLASSTSVHKGTLLDR